MCSLTRAFKTDSRHLLEQVTGGFLVDSTTAVKLIPQLAQTQTMSRGGLPAQLSLHVE
jgi:hypothetical protein